MYYRMHNHEAFDSSEPVYAMRFLAIFADYCYQELIHEDMALELVSNSLKGEAQHEFIQNNQHDRSVEPGFKHWPLVCNLLSTNCVTKRILHRAIEYLESLRKAIGWTIGIITRSCKKGESILAKHLVALLCCRSSNEGYFQHFALLQNKQ